MGINTGVYGNILAPRASINGGSGVINGNVVVNNWNSGIQINAYHYFKPVNIDTSTPVPVNHAPVASNSSASLDEDSSINLSLLSNASDADSTDVLTVRITTQPAHGTVTKNAGNTWTYTPAANYNGSDTFSYVVNDGKVDSNVATVSLTIKAVNDAPVVSNQSITVDNATSILIKALGTDVDGDVLSSKLISTAGHGTVTLNADGSFTYKATAGYVGTDSFSYKVNDGKLDSNLATVSLTVTAVAPPVLTSADLGLAGQFNAFIFNDFTATAGEVAGTMAVGHNFNVSAFSMDTTQKNYQGMSLIVGNQLTFNGGSTHGKATYGSSKTVNNLPQTDTVVKAAPPFSFADNKTQLTDLSTNLAAQTANGKTTVQFNGMTFQGDGTNGTQIFNVKGADLLNVTYANFVNLNPGQTIIINVSGDSGMQGGMPDGFKNYNTLFNFSTAKKLTFTNVGVNASILAPLATVQGGSGVIDGNVVVNNWNSNVYIANNRSFQAAGMPTKPVQASQTSTAMAMSVAAANPYATVVSQATPATAANNKTTTVLATPLQATSNSSAIVIPAGTTASGSNASSNGAKSTNTTAADGDLAMAALLDSLGNSLGSALQAQMDRALGNIC
ncbi:collagen-binding domain-containing protein [Undibacterium sp. JH2W]|uniref:collagen-binding domain-containing protein n=1 Tax=Undibacterium sp. JH2W TaxID=3413037 RepID=UPI003BF2AB8C